MSEWTEAPFAFVSPGELLAAAIVLPLVCVVSVALRFYARRMQRYGLGVDDWMSAVATVGY